MDTKKCASCKLKKSITLFQANKKTCNTCLARHHKYRQKQKQIKLDKISKGELLSKDQKKALKLIQKLPLPQYKIQQITLIINGF